MTQNRHKTLKKKFTFTPQTEFEARILHSYKSERATDDTVSVSRISDSLFCAT